MSLCLHSVDLSLTRGRPRLAGSRQGCAVACGGRADRGLARPAVVNAREVVAVPRAPPRHSQTLSEIWGRGRALEGYLELRVAHHFRRACIAHVSSSHTKRATKNAASGWLVSTNSTNVLKHIAPKKKRNQNRSAGVTASTL